MADFETYKNRFRTVRLERQDGILELTIHKNGGPALWGSAKGGSHDELGEAFYQVGRDPENRVVIITGTGDTFLTEFDPDMGEAPSASYWDRIYKEGKDLLQNLLEIECPVIGAVNGPAFIHAEIPTMSDIVIASDRAAFADKAHAPGNVVPGDGVHVWWPMLLGPNRARHFLLTGAEISSEEALRLGFVAEVVPHGQVMDRARAIARELAAKNPQMLRFSRVAMTQHIKRRMLDDLGYGLMLEGMGILSLMGK
jgi:enoyl-CoA hydratase/carnithine racemase